MQFFVLRRRVQNNNNVNAIINNKAIPSLKQDTSINIQAGESEIPANLDLGKTVISTIDPDNTLDGDIWCSIGGVNPNGERGITVRQITENNVEIYKLRTVAPSANPESIIANIQAGKYTTTSQSTEYTFTGMKIEQIPLPEEA